MVHSLGLHFGKPTEPQPGFYPFLCAMVLIVLSSILLVQAFRGRNVRAQPFGNILRPIILIIGLGVYILIYDFAGYVIATVILSAIVLRVLETKPWWILAIVSFAISIGSYILFDRILGVALPKGILAGLFWDRWTF